MTNSVDQKEIQQFSKDSDRWWDESGPFAPLHRLNPVRLSYIKAQICEHYDRDVDALDALKGLDILDVGCGGGLVCEPLARLGGNISGADADAQAIEVAQAHAEQSNLSITYYNQPAEEIDQQFDVVLALEIIEHVTDPAAFVESVSKLVKPGGVAIFSTLNRNPKSFLLGIVAAEYILRWVPKGTHSWKKFIRPSELSRFGRAAGLTPHNITGLIFNPLKDEFLLSKNDLDVNYLLTTKKT
jgi:2-polyprenyl-6-hydroxyphenyl methylase/3-demethylubiquinone-9 3-methyltransferase